MEESTSAEWCSWFSPFASTARCGDRYRMLRVAGSRAALRLQPPVRHVKGQCSLPPLHRRVEWAAARGDLDECRRLLRQPEALPSLVTEVERARVSGGRRVATRVIGTLTGYWLWNATAWAYAYRVLGAEAERLLAERDHQGGPRPNPDPDPSPGPGPGPDLNPTFPGSVEVELHMKSFSLRGETRSPDPRSPELSALPAEAEARAAGGGGGGTASSLDSPYDSPYRTPVEPRRMLVLAHLVHKSPEDGRPARPVRPADGPRPAGPGYRPRKHRLAGKACSAPLWPNL